MDNIGVRWLAIDKHLVSDMLANVSQLTSLYYMTTPESAAASWRRNALSLGSYLHK